MNHSFDLSGHPTLYTHSINKFTQGIIYSIGFRSSETLKGAAVLLRISSTVTPSAYSTSVSPSVGLTSNTARSVMIFHTQRGPVRGKLHSGRILGLPFLSVCSFLNYVSGGHSNICVMV